MKFETVVTVSNFFSFFNNSNPFSISLDVTHIELHNNINFFYQGKQSFEHFVRVELPNGIIEFFEGEQDFEYIATKLGISLKELHSYMDAPNKTYKDYKNQQFIYNLGAKVLKAIGLERGGKR